MKSVTTRGNLYALLSKNPTATLRTFDGIPVEQLRDQYSDIRFLRTESLNEDLVALLVESGIARQEIDFIVDHRSVIPKPAERMSIKAWLGYLSSRLPRKPITPMQQKTAGKETYWLALYSAADIDYVLRRDRFYFTLFPEMQPVHTGTRDD